MALDLPVPHDPATDDTWGEDLNAAISSLAGLDPLLPTAFQTPNLHATYGDDFTGTGIDAKWTRRTVASGNETWQAWRAELGVAWASPVAGWLYTQPAPGGDYTVRAAVAVMSGAATSLVGPVILDSTGTGRGAVTRASNGVFITSLTSYVYSGYGPGVGPIPTYDSSIWCVSLKKVGTNYTCSMQRALPDTAGFGTVATYSTASSWAGTPDRIGVGCVYTDAGLTQVSVLRFNVTA